MSSSGSGLEALLRRMIETPGEFQLEPLGPKGGQIHVDALISDTLRHLGGAPLSLEEARALQQEPPAALKLAMLACWLLHGPWFAGHPELAPAARVVLTTGLRGMAGAVRPGDCITDPDRREELVRTVLSQLGLRPAGEEENAARDRLTALDSVARARVTREAAEAMKRARAVRDAAAKAAAEAAASYGRE